ncbi:MAG TPA: type VI secretion system contractile sheath small subunit [Vicinamibacterales bacterium]|nr:type VI secretion system contractile sheath small subunit [Vicinamibacterales bacterium]
MPESLQHKLDRVRPPRVQITYDVELGGAFQKKELPFVVGILADLSGKPTDAPPPLKERKFVEIDRDNFNDVLASISPRLALQVANKLSKSGGNQNVELNFRHIDDFGPLNMIQQVESLRKLYEIRQRLSDLLTKLDGNEKLDALLTQVGRDPEGLKKVKAAIGDGGAR